MFLGNNVVTTISTCVSNCATGASPLNGYMLWLGYENIQQIDGHINGSNRLKLLLSGVRKVEDNEKKRKGEVQVSISFLLTSLTIFPVV